MNHVDSRDPQNHTMHFRTAVKCFPLMLAAMLISVAGCGSNNSSPPGPVVGPNLQAITVCIGTPVAPTPTPSTSPTVPTPTPTPCPKATTAAVVEGDQIFFNAQGTYVLNGATTLSDITNNPDTLWTSTNKASLQPPTGGNGGVYSGGSPGCACVAASSAGVSSLPVGVTVYAGAPTPVCPACPTPMASPTPAASVMGGLETSSHEIVTGVLQWMFDPGASIAGPIAPGPDGGVYFITVDGELHALDSAGHQRWQHPVAGTLAAVASNGTVFVESVNNHLIALAPDGSIQLSLDLASQRGPLAASHGLVYVQSGDSLIAIATGGTVKWKAHVVADLSAAVVADDGTFIGASEGAGVIAISGDGEARWDFHPDQGFSGAVASVGDAVYVGSKSGIVHALNLSDGRERWQVHTSAPVWAGPATTLAGEIFAVSDAIRGIDANGRVTWTDPLAAQGSASIATADRQVFVGEGDGLAAVINPSGAVVWTSRTFGANLRVAFAPDGTLYVGTDKGRIYAVR